MKIIIVGLGNPLLSDDGVGWRVAEEISKRILNSELFNLVVNKNQVDIECLAVGGLSLMEHLIGYEQAIIIDAMHTGESLPGTVFLHRLEDLPNFSSSHLGSIHDTSLQTALKLGRSMQANLPGDVEIVTVETNQIYDFSEQLSPPVEAALPKAVSLVMDLLRKEQ